MKFTFKTNQPTGRYKSFGLPSHDIKLNRKIVGDIDPENFKIRLMVIKKDVNEDGNPNCKWRWITLAKKSNSLNEAKEFLNNNIQVILNKYELNILEP